MCCYINICLLIIVLILSSYIYLSRASQSSCIKSNCNGPYKLKHYVYNIKEEQEIEKIIVYEFNDNAEKTTIEKKSVKYYCYNGVFDSYCEKNITSHNITDVEYDIKKCKVERLLPPYTAWGASSDKCYEDISYMYLEDRDGEYFNWEGKAPYLRYMCVEDWRCKIHSGKIPVHTKINATHATYKTYSTKGDDIIIGSNPFYNVIADGVINSHMYSEEKKRIYHTDGDFSTRIDYQPSSTKRETNATCYSRKTGETRTRLCKVAEFSTKTFEMTCHSQIGLCYGSSGNIGIVTKNNITSTETSSLHDDINKAASIIDLINTQRNILYYSENTNYNLEVLQYDVYNIYNIVTQLISSVGKLDDELVPNLLNKTGKTTWLTKEIFNICPCYKIDFKEGHNCEKGHIYDNGRVKKISKEEEHKCVAFKVEKERELPIFNNKEISINELEFEPPNGTSSDWEGWTWISEQRMSFLENTEFITKVTDPTNIVSQIFDSSGIFSFWSKMNFLFGTGILTYINTALLVILWLRR